MAITRDQVLHVAKLAQLGLSEEEVTRFSEQLSAILESVGKIAELDLAGIEPTSHPLDIVNVFGEDEPEPSLSLGEALANAPDAEDEAFGVPTP
jgi:aspartyl-tRNA(Asn)/glutamyl-tRNA(Gln) amidotransferase subunit C